MGTLPSISTGMYLYRYLYTPVQYDTGIDIIQYCTLPEP